MKKKGVSPLIATVLLIAFTMAIAGILALWARSFVGERTGQISSQEKCIGALDVYDLKFDNGTITTRIRNDGSINLNDIRADVTYADPSKDKTYLIKNYNGTDPLAPLERTSVVISTGDTTKPTKIEIFAANCPDYKITRTDF